MSAASPRCRRSRTGSRPCAPRRCVRCRCPRRRGTPARSCKPPRRPRRSRPWRRRSPLPPSSIRSRAC
ncbi:hypothetical protein F1D61_31955 [Methylobacterium aquaticum]|nr:hypothetical protein F1D61_31955 [Methylobacterium aquaticum]